MIVQFYQKVFYISSKVLKIKIKPYILQEIIYSKEQSQNFFFRENEIELCSPLSLFNFNFNLSNLSIGISFYVCCSEIRNAGITRFFHWFILSTAFSISLRMGKGIYKDMTS